jgi:hypothetical protein
MITANIALATTLCKLHPGANAIWSQISEAIEEAVFSGAAEAEVPGTMPCQEVAKVVFEIARCLGFNLSFVGKSEAILGSRPHWKVWWWQ